MTIPNNFTPTLPSLKDLLDRFGQNLLINMNCHHLATIESFNPGLQTAVATINYQKTYFVLNQLTGNYDEQNVSYPTLMDCPVVFLRGGLATLTFPVEPGDQCIVMFNDRDMDNWYAGSSTSGVATPRLHSFSDGVILIGLSPMDDPILEFDTERALLRYGPTGAMVGVGPELVKIANPLFTLNGLLQDLINTLESLVTNTTSLVTQTSLITVICSAPASPSSPPINAAAIAAIAAQLALNTVDLTLTATELGELLE